jgi:hypothetical protein
MKKLFLSVVLVFIGSPVMAQVYVQGGAYFGQRGCGGPKIPRAIKEIERDEKERNRRVRNAEKTIRTEERKVDDAKRELSKYEATLRASFRGYSAEGAPNVLAAVTEELQNGSRRADVKENCKPNRGLGQPLFKSEPGIEEPWANFCKFEIRKKTPYDSDSDVSFKFGAAEIKALRGKEDFKKKMGVSEKTLAAVAADAETEYVMAPSVEAIQWSKHVTLQGIKPSICSEPTFKKDYKGAVAPKTETAKPSVAKENLSPEVLKLLEDSGPASARSSSLGASSATCEEAIQKYREAKVNHDNLVAGLEMAKRYLSENERELDRLADDKDYEVDRWAEDLAERGTAGGICYTCMYGQEAEVSTTQKVAGILGVLGGAAIGVAGARYINKQNTEMGWPTNPLIYLQGAAPLIAGGLYAASGGGLAGGFGCGAGMAGGLGGGAGGGAFGYPAGAYGALGGGMFAPGMAYSGYYAGYPGYISGGMVGAIGGVGAIAGGYPMAGFPMAGGAYAGYPMAGGMVGAIGGLGAIAGGFPMAGFPIAGGAYAGYPMAGGMVGAIGGLGAIAGGFPMAGGLYGGGLYAGGYPMAGGMVGAIGGLGAIAGGYPMAGFPMAGGAYAGYPMAGGMVGAIGGLGAIAGGYPMAGYPIGGGMVGAIAGGYPISGGGGMVGAMSGSMAGLQYQMQMMQMYQAQMNAWMQEQQRMQQDYSNRTMMVGRLQEELVRIQIQIQQISTGAYGGGSGSVGIGGGYTPTGRTYDPNGGYNTDPNMNGPARGRGYPGQ